MKRCNQCGAQQADTRVFCLDCGKRLGASLSPEEIERAQCETEAVIDKMNNKSDALVVVDTPRKVLGIISLTCIVGAVVFMVMARPASYQKANVIYAIMMLTVSASSALPPRFLWEMQKFHLSFTIYDADNAEPSDAYLMMTKWLPWIFFGVALLLLLYAVYEVLEFYGTGQYNVVINIQ